MKTRSRVAIGSAFVAFASLLAVGGARADSGETARVSVDSAGGQGGGGSFDPSISADGRYLSFESHASNLVPGDTNGKLDVFVHDRATGLTTRVSVDSAGGQGNGLSRNPTVSADGRYVAFESWATNLVSGDTNGDPDVFVHDRATGLTTRVSVDSAGGQGNNFSEFPSISADGRYVAFESGAVNLVPGDTNASGDVFVHDRATGLTTRVSVNSAGGQGGGGSFDPSISADGRYLSFESHASNLVAGDTNGNSDVFVHDRATGLTTRVSVDSSGVQGNGSSVFPSISADGRYVAFESEAVNLVPGDTNEQWDVFVHDRATGLTTRVSVDSSGGQGNDFSDFPSISADGRYVSFESHASNLVPGDTNVTSDVFVHDRRAMDAMDATNRASVDSAGGQAGGPSFDPAMSASGRYVAFASDASNLVAGDTNLVTDVFLKDLIAGTTTRVSVDGAGGQAKGPSTAPTVSADGGVLAFVSGANLEPGDDNGQDDVYAIERVIGSSSLVSSGQGGAPANGRSGSPSISADGRYAAFDSLASNLVALDFNGASDVFIRDRQTQQTNRISQVAGFGFNTSGASTAPSISADGRYVAFVSDAFDLVTGDTNGVADIFVHDRDNDEDGIFDEPGAVSTVNVSMGILGQADAPSSAPSISADGRLVAFTSPATNLSPR